MRTMITSVAVFVLLGGFSASAAQLPPDIIADSYLLRAEQAVRDGEYTRAQGEINKLLDLQKEHELDLPDEFHFRYAKAAASTDWPEQALEAVVKYLAAAGREGQHYVEALELMNKAQDAIEGGKGPQAALTDQSPPAQAAEQGPVEAQLDAGRTPETQEVKQVLINAAVPTEAQPAGECNLWRWREGMFFRGATVQDVKACLEAGVDLNSRRKQTLLHRAARYNENPMVIEALVAAGADPNARDGDKETALHRAAAHNENPMVIEALMAAGANPKAKDKWGNTPLDDAKDAGNTNAIEVLRTSRKGGPPILSTHDCRMWRTDVFFRTATVQNVKACLEAGADPKEPGKYRKTPLHRAVEHNENPMVIEALLAAGADPNARDKYKQTPLYRAARYNENPMVIEALLAAGADPNARRDGDKETPLHWAARNEDPAAVQVLLAAGADPNARRDGDKETPLHVAAWRNANPAVITALLDAGADPRTQTIWGFTPLHRAARYNENPMVIEALLAAGADPNARNWYKNTPLDKAKYAGNITAIEVLRQPTADRERQVAAAQARRKAKSGPGFLEAVIGIAGGTAIAAAGGGTEEALEAGAVFAGGVIGGTSPRGSAAGVPAATSTGNVGTGTGGDSCEIPGYPSPPGGVANLGFSWCPASVTLQVRSFALQAAGAQCAIATGSSSTPEQINARRQEINAACGRLAALGARLDGPNSGASCRCPAGFGP